MLEQITPLLSLIIFGNIENLILASQAVVARADMKQITIATVICVILWILIGTVCTNALRSYEEYIELIGGLAILILGLQSMLSAIQGN